MMSPRVDIALLTHSAARQMPITASGTWEGASKVVPYHSDAVSEQNVHCTEGDGVAVMQSTAKLHHHGHIPPGFQEFLPSHTRAQVSSCTSKPNACPEFIFKSFIPNVLLVHLFRKGGISCVGPGKERFLLEGNSRWVVKVCALRCPSIIQKFKWSYAT